MNSAITALTATFSQKIEEYAAMVEEKEAQLKKVAEENKALNAKVADLAVKAELVSDGVSLAFVDRMNKYENITIELGRRIDDLTDELDLLRLSTSGTSNHVDAVSVAKVVNSAGLWRGFALEVNGFNIRAFRDTFMVSNDDVVITRGLFALHKYEITIKYMDSNKKWEFEYITREGLPIIEYTSSNKYISGAGRVAGTAKWDTSNKTWNIGTNMKMLKVKNSSVVEEWFHGDILAVGNNVFVGQSTLKLATPNAHLHYKSADIEVVYYSASDKIVVEFCIANVWFRADGALFDVVDDPIKIDV